MLVEGPHDAGHVDALLLGLKRNSARDRCLKRQIAIVAGVTLVWFNIERALTARSKRKE